MFKVYLYKIDEARYLYYWESLYKLDKIAEVSHSYASLLYQGKIWLSYIRIKNCELVSFLFLFSYLSPSYFFNSLISFFSSFFLILNPVKEEQYDIMYDCHKCHSNMMRCDNYHSHGYNIIWYIRNVISYII